MTNQTTGMPEFGTTVEPIYTNDNVTTMHEKMRVFFTQAVRCHEQKHAEGDDGDNPDSIPCMSLAVPCYLFDKDSYADALSAPTRMLAVAQDEAARLGYTLLGVTPAVFGIQEGGTYQTGADRAPGWKMEVTKSSNLEKFFDEPEQNHIALTRLWLELSIQIHGPMYAKAMNYAQEGNEAEQQLRKLMGDRGLRA